MVAKEVVMTTKKISPEGLTWENGGGQGGT